MSGEGKEEEAIRQFAEITATDEALAHSILQDVDYNLELALAQYYGGDVPASGIPKPPPSTSSAIAKASEYTTLKPQKASTVKASGEPGRKRQANAESNEIPSELTLVDGLDEINLKRRFTAALVVIAKINPEVIFLQEVVDEMVPQIMGLFDPMYHVFYSTSQMGEPYYNATMVSRNMEITRHNVIHFGTSIMGRSMLVVEAQWQGLRLNLINSHLESLKDYSKQRTEQFSQCVKEMKRLHGKGEQEPTTLTIFGGDLNIRDNEVSAEIDGKMIRDAWVEAGCSSHTKFTWDTLLNDNTKSGFKARCRFDRIYYCNGPYTKVDFTLHGKERIKQIHCFPSDHFALCCRFHSANATKVAKQGTVGDAGDKP